ncbi:MAG TPA: hypothetical protein VFO31_17295 [Vicinamibacterales bacterium]|nr:hypothetical protein [Vicinamibacterales bacterium]
MRRRGWASVALSLAVTLLFESAPAFAQAPESASVPTVAASLARVKQALAEPGGARFDVAPQEPQPYFPEQPFWTKRRVGIAIGIAGAATAATVALFKEKELRGLKSDLEDLPPGSNDEWAALREEADLVMKERNFWLAAAIGVGGFTAAYAIALRSYEIPIVRPPRTATPGARRATVGLRPTMRGLMLRWSF